MSNHEEWRISRIFREIDSYAADNARKIFWTKKSWHPRPKQKPSKPTFTRRAPYGGRYKF